MRSRSRYEIRKFRYNVRHLGLVRAWLIRLGFQP